MRVEFEISKRRTAALQDDHDFTIFVQQSDHLPRQVGVAYISRLRTWRLPTVALRPLAFRLLTHRNLSSGATARSLPTLTDTSFGSGMSAQ